MIMDSLLIKFKSQTTNIAPSAWISFLAKKLFSGVNIIKKFFYGVGLAVFFKEEELV